VNLVDELHAVCAALVQSGVRHAVCGGVAVTVYGATRSTKDIDILVAPEDLARALDVVRPLGYAFAAFPMVFDEGTERQRTVQRVSKLEEGQHLVLDFLVAEASLQGFLDGSVKVELPQGPIVVVSRDVLIAMKRQAGRTQDLADLEHLERGDGNEGGQDDG
jgi:hypothetical protein